MDFIAVLKFLGGLGLLLYGMTIMGDSLEKLAGERLEKTLEKMTGNLFKGVVLGALVTSVIQSSTGTTVMVVGFVNAGIMNLKQAVGIIMGANIGTTITAQILRLDTSGSGSLILQYLKPSVLCYLIVAIGAAFTMISKNKKLHTLGEILLGIGMLFMGMSIMEGSVEALKELPAFEQMFITLQNPFLGIIVGAVVTAIIHSSAASVGILQAAAATGAVSYAAAIPIIMGQNIGTCCTALVSSLGGNKNAKRAAMIHFYFNLIGSIIFIVGIYSLNAIVGFSFWNSQIDKAAIANFHTVFNITTTLIFLPFSKVLVYLAEKTIKATGNDLGSELALLDERFYSTPAVALEQCNKVAQTMGEIALCNFLLINDSIIAKKPFSPNTFNENEDLLDRCESRLSSYMLGIKDSTLSDAGKQTYAEIMHVIGDFERIGDYSENLMDQYILITDKNVSFSSEALDELKIMCDATEEIIRLTNSAYSQSDSSLVPQIEALEDIIDTIKETLKNKHIIRLQTGDCTINNGIPFLDIIHNYEKISDHCTNVAVYVAMNKDSIKDFDVSEYRKIANAKDYSESFEKWVSFYDNKYLKPINI